MSWYATVLCGVIKMSNLFKWLDSFQLDVPSSHTDTKIINLVHFVIRNGQHIFPEEGLITRDDTQNFAAIIEMEILWDFLFSTRSPINIGAQTHIKWESDVFMCKLLLYALSRSRNTWQQPVNQCRAKKTIKMPTRLMLDSKHTQITL